ncbi:MAG TPA: hypothetical protein PK066_15405 [Saprospiraceae bacterium]|nr:hypothetical protein [Saprospiraceae bacterium]HQU54299.1 hypothetical protein [Saprospiraceae bacterium]
MRLTAEELHRLDEYLLGRGTSQERESIRVILESNPDWQAAAKEQIQLYRQLKYSLLNHQLQALREIEKKLTQGGDLGEDSALIANNGAGRHYKTPIMTEETPNRDALRFHGLMQMARQLQSIEQQGHPLGRETRKRLHLGRILAIAAGFFVLVLGIWPWIKPATEGEKLFQANFVAPDLSIQSRGMDQNSIDSLQKLAYGAYITGEYRRSLKFFRRIGDLPDSTYTKIYGITLLLNNRPEEAITLFQNGKQRWPEGPKWDQWIGWALLKENKVQEAQEYLNLDL